MLLHTIVNSLPYLTHSNKNEYGNNVHFSESLQSDDEEDRDSDHGEKSVKSQLMYTCI